MYAHRFLKRLHVPLGITVPCYQEMWGSQSSNASLGGDENLSGTFDGYDTMDLSTPSISLSSMMVSQTRPNGIVHGASTEDDDLEQVMARFLN